MTKARLDGLYFMLMGSAVFLLLGPTLESAPGTSMGDFVGIYYEARCMYQGCDPYNESQAREFYIRDRGESALNISQQGQLRMVTRAVNLPGTLFLIIPLAVIPWGPAHIIWMALILGISTLSSFLIWDIAADYAPAISGALIGFLLANSALAPMIGNTAGVAVGLCVFATWSFLKDRFVPLGIVSLAVSLAMKPHDAGLVWLFFLVAGGSRRKLALQVLAVTLALNLPAILWATHLSPHWTRELNSNISAFSARGAVNDPGPASSGAHGLGMMVNLQTVISYIRDDPRFYNSITYVICGGLLLVWLGTTIRSRLSPSTIWFALAAISALTMLPVYHRQSDTKLLLLTVPACALLSAEGGIRGTFTTLLTAAAFVLTGEIPWAIVLRLISHINLPNTQFFRGTLIAMQVLPIPLILLSMSAFYLWVYSRRTSDGLLPNCENAE